SETYHVQGIHREMLGMADDVNGPQVIWPRHGRLVQSYGLPSPRQRRPGGDEDVFASFVDVMGGRIGGEDATAPRPELREGDAPRAKPFDAELPPDAEPPFGLVLNQDVGNFARTQRGLHQPGFTHLTVSPTEECRVVNLHRTLEQYLGIGPEDG